MAPLLDQTSPNQVNCRLATLPPTTILPQQPFVSPIPSFSPSTTIIRALLPNSEPPSLDLDMDPRAQKKQAFVAALTSSIANAFFDFMSEDGASKEPEPCKIDGANREGKGFIGRLGKFEEGKGFSAIEPSHATGEDQTKQGREVETAVVISSSSNDRTITEENRRSEAIEVSRGHGVENPAEQGRATNLCTSQVETAVVVYNEAAAKSTEGEWDTYRPWSSGADVAWDTYRASSGGKKREPAPLLAVKQEHESSTEKVVVTYQDPTHRKTVFGPQAASGLSASRFAAEPSTNQIAVIKQETKQLPSNSQKSTGQLADPADFMSAAAKRTASFKPANSATRPSQGVPAPAKPVTTTTSQNRAPTEPAKPIATKVQQTKPQPKGTKNGEYSDEKFAAGIRQKYLGARGEPPSWPRFPPSGHDRVVADEWGSPQIISSGVFSPPAPEPQTLSHEQSTSAWNSFAKVEEKENKTPYVLKRVAFVPASTPAEAVDVQSKAPAVQQPAKGATEYGPQSSAPANSKPLSKFANQDKEMLHNLTEAFIQQGSELETIRQELAVYKSERRALDKEMAILQTQAEQHKRDQYELKKVQDEFKKVRDELAALKAKLAAPSAHGVAPTSAHLDWLETRIRELEREVAVMRPLFEIGRDVRVQFLEEARVEIFKLSRTETDKAILDQGIAASHHANWKVDATLMTGGVISLAHQRLFGPLFKIMYGEDPDRMDNLSDKFKAAMEAFATIQVSPGLNSCHPALPSTELSRIKTLVHTMAGKHEQLGAKVFEEDRSGHAATYLDEIQNYMIPIVKFIRKWHRVSVRNQLEMDKEKAAAAAENTTPAKN